MKFQKLALLLLVFILNYSYSFKINSNLSLMKTRRISRNDNKNFKLSNQNADIIPGVGIEGCKLPSPSGINQLPAIQQAGIFGLLSIALYVGTLGTLQIFNLAEQILPGFMQSWEKSFFLLGFFFALAGASHFSVKKEFVNIYPSQGAWGFWYLPGSPEFHVEWTGYAELLGGIWLLVGGLSNLGLFSLPVSLGPVMQDGARALLYLTIAVTPANIYMLTHGY